VIIIAKTLKGLEEVLKKEVETIGGKNIEKLTRAIKFEGDEEMLYKSCLMLRTAVRIVKFLGEYKVKSYDDLYTLLKKMPWESLIGLKDTFAIRAVTASAKMNHSMFLGQKSKDAIVDRFYAKFEKRPNINPVSPDFWIDIHLRENDTLTVSIDASGDPLNMRGYRIYPVEAPINEVLAAGLILLSGWQKEDKFMDPMCGSGTLVIEAALMAAGLPPHHINRKFGFEKWKDFDSAKFEAIKKEAYSKKNKIPNLIIAKDKSLQSLKAAETNAREIGVAEFIKFERKDFFNDSKFEGFTVITNPPYDERLKLEDSSVFYKSLGDHLKKHYINCNFHIISSNTEGLKAIGLKPTFRKHLLNGSLDVEFQRYEIYEGSKRGE
jgi:putative N6-adenine-specific DNA methylase